MNYDDCIDVIDNLEEIEQVIITKPRYRMCCYNMLELCKLLLNYAKNIKKSR